MIVTTLYVYKVVYKYIRDSKHFFLQKKEVKNEQSRKEGYEPLGNTSEWELAEWIRIYFDW